MSKQQVAILGVSGMLGSMLLDYFARHTEHAVIATVREPKARERLHELYPDVEMRLLDAEAVNGNAGLEQALDGAQWVINAIGVIKPFAQDNNPAHIEHAVRVNADFPLRLARFAEAGNLRVLQIATDCVYSGVQGHYGESAKHDPLDVYGKTKSLGESLLPCVANLRCSIIGPEAKGFVSLLDWFRRQPKGAQLNGFSNHYWNGVTTLQFARVCQGAIERELSLPHVQHVVPADQIAKADLLESFKREWHRDDIAIKHVEVQPVVDRTLSTDDEALNRKLWQAAGYERPPTIEAMVAELASYDCPLAGALA